MAMGSPTDSFLYDAARRQAICVLRCRLVNAELQQWPEALQDSSLERPLSRLFQDIKQRIEDVLAVEILPGIGKLSRLCDYQQDPYGGDKRILNRERLESRLHNLEQPGAQSNPLDLLASSQNRSGPVQPPSQRMFAVHCLQFAEVLDALRHIDASLPTHAANAQRVYEVRNKLSHHPQSQAQDAASHLQELQDSLDRMQTRVKRRKLSPLADPRLREWKQFTEGTLNYVAQQLQTMPLPNVETAILSEKTNLQIVPPKLISSRSELEDPAWIPRILADEILSQASRQELWEELNRQAQQLDDAAPVSDESTFRGQMAQLFCRAYDRVLDSYRDDPPRDPNNPLDIQWFRKTCARLLGKRYSIEVYALSDLERVQAMLGQNSESFLTSVAPGQPRRLQQLGVTVSNHAVKQQWLLPYHAEVPQPWPALELKLDEVARQTDRFSTLLCQAADRLGSHLRQTPRHQQGLETWLSELDPQQQREVREQIRNLLCELTIVHCQAESSADNQQAGCVLDLLEAEGFTAQLRSPPTLGRGIWKIRTDTGPAAPPLFGLAYDVPESDSATATAEAPLTETIVTLKAESPLNRFLIDSQASVRLIRESLPDWSGWKSYDALLLSQQSQTPTAQNWDSPIDWLETIWNASQLNDPAMQRLLIQHANGLQNVLDATQQVAVVPRRSPSTGCWQTLTAEDYSHVDYQWEDAPAPHGHVLRCDRVARIDAAAGTAWQRGSIVLSRGPDFPEALKSALQLCQQADQSLTLPPTHPLLAFIERVPEFEWHPTEFKTFCEQVKADTNHYFDDVVEGQQWFNQWVHGILERNQPWGWFEWFEQQDWFRCLPQIDRQQRRACWPAGEDTGYRFIGVEASEHPVGQVLSLADTEFGVAGYLVHTMISAGPQPTDAIGQAEKLRTIVVQHSHEEGFSEVGKPVMRWVHDLRDPLDSPPSQPPATALLLEVIDRLTTFANAGQAAVADACLEVISEVLHFHGYHIEPSQWTFTSGLPESVELPADQLVYTFSDEPPGSERLRNLGLTRSMQDAESQVIRPCQIDRCAGPAPAGFVELQVLADGLAQWSQNWPQPQQTALAEIGETLERLPYAVSKNATSDPVYCVVDLWQQSMDYLLPYLASLDAAHAQPPEASDSGWSHRWDTALRSLVNSFQLSTYGQAGRRINELHNDFEEWFDYDPVQLSQASQDGLGAPLIRVVDCPGLIRNGSATPLLKARIQL